MFNSKNLKVGDKFYSVKERNAAFIRKKIHKEIDGEDWFKYDTPPRTYELETYDVLGILRKELEGKWEDEFPEVTEYYVQNKNRRYVMDFVEYSMTEENYFVDKDEALVYKSKLEAEARKLDME